MDTIFFNMPFCIQTCNGFAFFPRSVFGYPCLATLNLICHTATSTDLLLELLTCCRPKYMYRTMQHWYYMYGFLSSNATSYCSLLIF